jgi:hypothetical protein
MKVSNKAWTQAIQNLIDRRKKWAHADDNRKLHNPVRDYKLHMIKCGHGDSVLDVGCGNQFLKTCLPEHVEYIGMDAFPIDGLDVMPGKIEDLQGIEVDTVCAFAVLDNCQDFQKACDAMKRAARNNIVILTGIGIEVDQYHTHKLELSDFTKAFEGWQCTRSEEIQPKVWLLNYQR